MTPRRGAGVMSRTTVAVRRRDRRSDQRGNTLVEFTVASIVFFTIVFGLLDLALVVYDYDRVAFAAQEGARWAAVRGKSSTSPATADDVKTYVTTRAIGLAPTVTTTWSPTDKSVGSVVTVQVSQPFTSHLPFVALTSMTLHSTAQMVVAR